MPPADKELRRRVEERAARHCEYCRSPLQYSPASFSLDHVIPLARGGTTEPSNLALACQGCNSRKHAKVTARDPVSGATVPLFNPRRARWSEHFSWSPDTTTVIGLSPSGRATVEALRLNREGLVAQRRLLFEAGEHPPAEPGSGE